MFTNEASIISLAATSIEPPTAALSRICTEFQRSLNDNEPYSYMTSYIIEKSFCGVSINSALCVYPVQRAQYAKFAWIRTKLQSDGGTSIWAQKLMNYYLEALDRIILCFGATGNNPLPPPLVWRVLKVQAGSKSVNVGQRVNVYRARYFTHLSFVCIAGVVMWEGCCVAKLNQKLSSFTFNFFPIMRQQIPTTSPGC